MIAKKWIEAKKQVEKWKSTEILPAPIKRGGRVYYLRSQIEKMLNDQKGGPDHA